MKLGTVVHLLGALLVLLGLSLVFPLAFALYYGDGDAFAIFGSLLIMVGSGAIAFFTTKTSGIISIRDGFAIVGLGWIAASLFGSLPFLLSGAIPSFTDAFFETMSGFSTTGASILTDIESVGRGILFWRSQTHWLGGMGIIVFSLAILPLLGVGGMQLFKAEVPGPVPDKLKPRVQETAKILWYVYILISAVQTILLMAGGMSFYESLCHTFGTMATGGFSTRNASVASYNSAYFDYIIIIFMFIAGVNFSLHYQALRGKFTGYFKDREFLFYLGLTAMVTLIVVIVLRLTYYDTVADALRYGLFQVLSLLTTTGYCTADYEQWTSFLQILLFSLMFVGGCAGSTGGGMKNVRIMLLLKYVVRELRMLLHPKAVISIKYGKQGVTEEVISGIVGFFLLYVFIFVGTSIIMTLLGTDLITSVSCAAATLGNIGPGLGNIGPTDNYAHLPAAAKWLLSFCMLLGRLEIYTILLLLMPEFWRK